MKKLMVMLSAISLCAGAFADSFSDATGETIVGGIMDITSVDVANTANQLIFTINIAGDPVATDWGKYLVGINTTGGGDTAGNGWGRPISMSTGMDYWLGSWVDTGNGAELWNYSGSWSLVDATYNANTINLSTTKDTSSVTVAVDLSALGLAVGNSFTFDVYTTGGGGSDGAIDALSDDLQTIANWGDAYQSGSVLDSYTIVPEPSVIGLAALAGALVLLRRRRR